MVDDTLPGVTRDSCLGEWNSLGPTNVVTDGRVGTLNPGSRSGPRGVVGGGDGGLGTQDRKENGRTVTPLAEKGGQESVEEVPSLEAEFKA